VTTSPQASTWSFCSLLASLHAPLLLLAYMLHRVQPGWLGPIRQVLVIAH
jgi:hypothetical protein